MLSGRARVVLSFMVGGLACVGLAGAHVAVLSPLGGLAALVVLPAAAAVHWASSEGDGDGLERAAFAYAGLALSCWSVWVARAVAGLGGTAVLVAPVALSAIVAAARRPVSDSGPDGSGPLDARMSRLARLTVWVTGVTVVILVAVPFLPYGWETADGIHRMGMTDWYKHLMVTTALEDPGFPPPNPFLITAARAPYYYGFHLLAAALRDAVGGLDPYVALLSLTLATAAAFPVVVFVFARGLLGDARRAAYAASGATLLAGFDLVVWMLHAVRDISSAWPLSLGASGLRAAVPSTHLDFWIHHNERQFNPPYISLIWAPQHVAAVLIALLALHAIWRAATREDGGSRLLPAVMLACVPALSAYVAIGLAAGLAGCVAIDSWRARCVFWKSDAFLRWRVVGLIAALAALPIGWVLARAPAGQLTVAVSSAGSLLNGAVFSVLLGDNTLARLLDSPALYLVEFGIVGLLGLAGVRARMRSATLSPRQREAVAIAATILVLVTLVRPPAGAPNNVYARPMLMVWSIVACFAADAWCVSAGRRRWRTVGIAVGAGGVLLGALGATAEGLAFWATPVDEVNAARWINTRAGPTTVVAADPDRHNLGYWLRRRTVVADRRHALLFGATREQYDETLGRLREAYGATDGAEAARRFTALGADVVVVDSPAPGWMQAPCFGVGFHGPRVIVARVVRPVCGGSVDRGFGPGTAVGRGFSPADGSEVR